MGGVHSTPNIHAIHVTVIVQCGESKSTCSWFCYHPHWQLNFIRFACKTDGKIFFLIFFICYFFYKYN